MAQNHISQQRDGPQTNGDFDPPTFSRQTRRLLAIQLVRARVMVGEASQFDISAPSAGGVRRASTHLAGADHPFASGIAQRM